MIGCELVFVANRKLHEGLVPNSLTLNGVMTDDPRYLCTVTDLLVLHL